MISLGARRGFPTRGSPNSAMESNNHTAKIVPSLVPLPENAVAQYEAAGGTITNFSNFGVDPIANNLLVQQRNASFQQRYPTIDFLFHKLVNGDDRPFRDAIHFLTETLAPSYKITK